MTPEKLGLQNEVMRVLFILACAVFLLGAGSMRALAQAEYRLGIGDKVRVYVFGQKDLDRSATVDVSGRIWLPTIGRIEAANLTLDELHEKISTILAANSIIRTDDINVEVVEFRPFYILGGVARPGSYPFSPGLTVRQAIALAGGLARASSEQIGYLAQSDPRSSYVSIMSEYVHRLARVDRLQAELELKDDFEWQPSSALQAPPDILKSIAELQNKEFHARAEKFGREKSDIEELIQLAKAEVTTLEQQNERLEEEDKRVTRNLSELRELKEKGVVSLARIDSFERDVFSSRYARDSTRSQLAGARRQHAELVGKRAQMDLTRQEEISRELNIAKSELDVLHAQLIAAATRTNLAGQSIERLCALGGKDEGIFINRQEDGKNKRVPASEDSEVRPGDTIEVNVQNDMLRTYCSSRNSDAGSLPAVQNATR